MHTTPRLISRRVRPIIHQWKKTTFSHVIIYNNTQIYELPTFDTYTYEDARIHAMSDGSVYAFVCKYQFNTQPSQIACLHFNPFTQTLLDEHVLHVEEYAPTTQKNWVTYYENGHFLVIPFLNPLTIYTYHPITKTLQLVQSNPKYELSVTHFRGSTQLIKKDAEYIGISHARDGWKGYTHNVYIINADTMTLTSYSKSFVFDKHNYRLDLPILIEFASGMAKLDETTARITFGVFNEKAMYVDIPIQDLVEMGREIIVS